MLKIVSRMSGPSVIPPLSARLKSVVIVPKRSKASKFINEKDLSHKLIRLNNFAQSKQKIQSAYPGNNNKNHKTTSDDISSTRHKKNWPSIESLSRHANFRPLGVTDDWGPLSHKHELMPMDNVRYWHQHRCETCDKLFEHKHKQRGDQSMNYNKHICNVCGGTSGSRRVLFKNSQPSFDYRKNR